MLLTLDTEAAGAAAQLYARLGWIKYGQIPGYGADNSTRDTGELLLQDALSANGQPSAHECRAHRQDRAVVVIDHAPHRRTIVQTFPHVHAGYCHSLLILVQDHAPIGIRPGYVPPHDGGEDLRRIDELHKRYDLVPASIAVQNFQSHEWPSAAHYGH